MRWTIDTFSCRVDVCSATTGSYADGRPDEDFVLDNSGGDDKALDDDWQEEFTVEVKSDGFSRMWAEELNLGADGIVEFVPVFEYIKKRSAELLQVEWDRYTERRKQNSLDAAARIEASHRRVKQRKP